MIIICFGMMFPSNCVPPLDLDLLLSFLPTPLSFLLSHLCFTQCHLLLPVVVQTQIRFKNFWEAQVWQSGNNFLWSSIHSIFISYLDHVFHVFQIPTYVSIEEFRYYTTLTDYIYPFHISALLLLLLHIHFSLICFPSFFLCCSHFPPSFIPLLCCFKQFIEQIFFPFFNFTLYISTYFFTPYINIFFKKKSYFLLHLTQFIHVSPNFLRKNILRSTKFAPAWFLELLYFSAWSPYPRITYIFIVTWPLFMGTHIACVSCLIHPLCKYPVKSGGFIISYIYCFVINQLHSHTVKKVISETYFSM